MIPSPEPAPSPPWWQVVLIGRQPKRTLCRLVILLITCFVVFRFVLTPVRIDGISMEPTLRNGQIGAVYRLAFLTHEPRRGDIVAVSPLAGERSGYYLKRVVGLPGETVAFGGGRLLINGRLLDEPYVKGRYNWRMEPITTGADEYYVVGDNRGMDIRDHFQGRVLRSQIIGRRLL